MKLQGLINATNIVILFFALLSINYLGTKFHMMFDFTEGGLYSLSDGSKKIVKEIDDEAAIKYFFSQSNENLPVMIKNYGRRVEDLLREFASFSPNLSLEVYDPKPDSDEEELAAKYGIKGAQAGEGDPFYMGAAVLYHDKIYNIPFFDPRKETFLEYEIANLLARLKDSGEKKVLGVLSAFPLSTSATPPDFNRNENSGNWLFVDELEKSYTKKELPMETEEIPSDVSLLLVLHPRGITDKTEYAIEQYILKGGKAVIAVDPSAKSDPEKNSPYAQYGMQKASSSNLKNIFEMLELTYDPKKVVVDREHATRVGTSGGSVQYPYWLSLDSNSFNKDLILTSQLSSALFVEAGFFQTKPDSKNTYASLINSGSSSGTIDSQRLSFVSPGDFDSYDKENKSFSLAGIVSGTFESAFKKKPADSKYSAEHTAKAPGENTVFVIADADFLNNNYCLRELSFFGQTILQPINQNIVFLSNALEFISGSRELISIRSRGSFNRPFDRVEEIEKRAQDRWFNVERELTQKIQDLQQKLNELQRAKTQDNQLMLSREQQDEINRFKVEQMEFKRKRREVRKNLRQDIEKLGTTLTLLNMCVVPLIVLLTGMYIYVRRSKGNRLLGRKQSHV
jgi:ABC-type uncharacterized transport system involved in gliding motility auxiliary subunit